MALISPREEAAEFSRLCVVREWRNWCTLQAMYIGIQQSLVRAQKRHFAGCCTSKPKQSYSWIFGVRYVGEAIMRRDLGDTARHLFVCDLQEGMAGTGLS